MFTLTCLSKSVRYFFLIRLYICFLYMLQIHNIYYLFCYKLSSKYARNNDKYCQSLPSKICSFFEFPIELHPASMITNYRGLKPSRLLEIIKLNCIVSSFIAKQQQSTYKILNQFVGLVRNVLLGNLFICLPLPSASMADRTMAL